MPPLCKGRWLAEPEGLCAHLCGFSFSVLFSFFCARCDIYKNKFAGDKVQMRVGLSLGGPREGDEESHS